jgi:hypothetical protein
VKISYGGSPPKEGCLRLDPSNIPWLVVEDATSLQIVFGNNAPLRAAFFTWSAALSKILTMDNLRKWHVIDVMCKKN